MALPERTPPQLDSSEKRSFGKGLFRKCDDCSEVHTVEHWLSRWQVCSSCGHHHAMKAAEWRRLLLDDAALERWDEHLAPTDPLAFVDKQPYPARVARAKRATGSSEAIEIGRAKLAGHALAYGAFEFGFMGGSMGSVVGERIARLFERATSQDLPVLLLHTSGGARMQEGILSLMQMAKTVAALSRFRAVRRPYISVLLDPTFGGVAAGTALLGDVNIAEPKAAIGFAGKSVIESTIRTTLPEGFQRAEFLLTHGMVDAIVTRPELRGTIATLLGHLNRAAQNEAAALTAAAAQ